MQQYEVKMTDNNQKSNNLVKIHVKGIVNYGKDDEKRETIYKALVDKSKPSVFSDITDLMCNSELKNYYDIAQKWLRGKEFIQYVYVGIDGKPKLVPTEYTSFITIYNNARKIKDNNGREEIEIWLVAGTTAKRELIMKKRIDNTKPDESKRKKSRKEQKEMKKNKSKRTSLKM